MKERLKDIADRIDAHLSRFERDKQINRNTKPDGSGCSDYYVAGAGASGRYVYVRYICYQNRSALTRNEAKHYLSLLDSGFIGRHFEAFRKHPVPL